MLIGGIMAALWVFWASADVGPALSEAPTRPAVQLARKSSAARLVDRGIQFYYEGRYQNALKLLMKALRSQSLDPARRLGALQYQAFCQVALGNSEGARATFTLILKQTPEFRLAAGTAPKIIKLFEEVLANMTPVAPPPAPSLAHSPPASLTPGRATVLEAIGQHLPDDSRVVVFYRWDASAPYSRQHMRREPDGRWTANLPAHLGTGPAQLSYYLVASDASERQLATAGDQNSPLALHGASPPPPPAEPEEEGTSIHWWIWPVVGAVLVGAGLAVGLTLASGGEKTGEALVRFDLVD
jgi:tetratricopeptide (TPR) repeat protein